VLLKQMHIKVCLYRTRPRLCGVHEGMVEIKQTKVVHTERDRRTRLYFVLLRPTL